jgi:hypothetical protein
MGPAGGEQMKVRGLMQGYVQIFKDQASKEGSKPAGRARRVDKQESSKGPETVAKCNAQYNDRDGGRRKHRPKAIGRDGREE